MPGKGTRREEGLFWLKDWKERLPLGWESEAAEHGVAVSAAAVVRKRREQVGRFGAGSHEAQPLATHFH